MRLRDRAPSSPRIGIYKGHHFWHVYTPGKPPTIGAHATYTAAWDEARRILRTRAIRAIQDSAA